MGCTPKELAEMTDVPHSSVHKTLARLRKKDSSAQSICTGPSSRISHRHVSRT
ncbi:MarR family transcriptional regulator [Halovenus amylolytica]